MKESAQNPPKAQNFSHFSANWKNFAHLAVSRKIFFVERLIERQFTRGITEIGGESIKVTCLGRRGFPDREIWLPNGDTLWIEFKSKNGKLSPQQKFWAKRASELNRQIYVVRSLDEANDFLKNLS